MLAASARAARAATPRPTLLHRPLATVAPSPTSLADVIKLDALADKSASEIASLWASHHADAARHRAGTVLAAGDYSTFASRAAAAPTFVLPLAKPGGGVLTLVAQVQAPVSLVTTVDEFKAVGSAAPAHVIVTYYPDLAASKGIVLVRADVLGPHVASPEEARIIMDALHRAYVDDAGHALVRAFNHAPATFSFDALLSFFGLGGSGERKKGGRAQGEGGGGGGGKGD